MTRTITDMAKLLDSMVGYDPNDPITAHGVGQFHGINRINRHLPAPVAKSSPARI